MTAFDDLLAELATDIDGLSAPAASGLFAGCCQALRPHYRRWAEHRGTDDGDVLDAALGAAGRFATSGAAEAGADALLERVEAATPPGDAPDEYSSTFAQSCWICGDLALRTAVSQDGGPGYGIEYALDPVVTTATERLYGVSQVGSGPDEDAQMLAVLAEPDVRAAVEACRAVVARLADRPVLTEDDLQVAEERLAPLSPP
jgi:hypothetical protein